MSHMPDFEAWAIFAKVTEQGSFGAAGQELGLKDTLLKEATGPEKRIRTVCCIALQALCS